MNGLIISIIFIPTMLLVIYLAFIMEESKLLKIIYGKLSEMNPDVRKRTFTSSSKLLITAEIISILENATDNKTVTGSIRKEEKSYQKMEKLAVLYAKKVGTSLSSDKMCGVSKIGRLRNVNRILDSVA